jgi:hypothetical protein
MRRLLLPRGAWSAHAVPANVVRRGTSAKPEYRSSADPGSHAKQQSDRADDVAVVPADAYEYRHLPDVAQP